MGHDINSYHAIDSRSFQFPSSTSDISKGRILTRYQEKDCGTIAQRFKQYWRSRGIGIADGVILVEEELDKIVRGPIVQGRGPTFIRNNRRQVQRAESRKKTGEARRRANYPRKYRTANCGTRARVIDLRFWRRVSFVRLRSLARSLAYSFVCVCFCVRSFPRSGPHPLCLCR